MEPWLVILVSTSLISSLQISGGFSITVISPVRLLRGDSGEWEEDRGDFLSTLGRYFTTSFTSGSSSPCISSLASSECPARLAYIPQSEARRPRGTCTAGGGLSKSWFFTEKSVKGLL